MDDLEKQLGTFAILPQALCIIWIPSLKSNLPYSPKKLNSGRSCGYFVPCGLEICRMTLENHMAPLLYYIKLCAPFQFHQWSRTWVTVRKRSIRVKISDFLSSVTLEFDGLLWKTIGHLFYNTLSFVHHFKAMGEFPLELQSGNPQFGSKSAIFCPVWPWNVTHDLEK